MFTSRAEALDFAHECLLSSTFGAQGRCMGYIEENMWQLAESGELPRDVLSEMLLIHSDAFVAELRRCAVKPEDVVRVLRQPRTTLAVCTFLTFLAHEAERYRGAPDVDEAWLQQVERVGARRWWTDDAPLLLQLVERAHVSVTEMLRVSVAVLGLCPSIPGQARLRSDEVPSVPQCGDAACQLPQLLPRRLQSYLDLNVSLRDADFTMPPPPSRLDGR